MVKTFKVEYCTILFLIDYKTRLKTYQNPTAFNKKPRIPARFCEKADATFFKRKKRRNPRL